MLALGQMPGAIIGGLLTDRCGRKKAILLQVPTLLNPSSSLCLLASICSRSPRLVPTCFSWNYGISTTESRASLTLHSPQNVCYFAGTLITASAHTIEHLLLGQFVVGVGVAISVSSNLS